MSNNAGFVRALTKYNFILNAFVEEGDVMSSDLASFQLLQNALKAANLRQQVYANNIANADTPGFKRSDVRFETMLANALHNGGSTPLNNQQMAPTTGNAVNWTAAASVQPVVTTDTTTSVNNNGNNVNVDDEMVSLAENQLRYNALTEDITLRLARIQTAIKGG